MMSTLTKPELVINALLISDDNIDDYYEFVLNERLDVVACGHVDTPASDMITRVPRFSSALRGCLFELNHVRINPRLDNALILEHFINALEDSGVGIYNPPTQGMMAVCFRPIGELNDVVRFYITPDKRLVLLCAAVKLRIVK